MTPADSVHSTPPLNTPILHQAASVLDELAAGIRPDRARLIAAALALDTLVKTTTPSRDLLDAAAGLQILATGGTLDLDETGRLRARQFAETVRQLMVVRDPIYAAIEAHRASYAAYEAAAEASDEDNDEAFHALDQASQRLMRAEASTLAGLTALLRYVAQLLRRQVAQGCRTRSPSPGAGARPTAHSARTWLKVCRRFWPRRLSSTTSQRPLSQAPGICSTISIWPGTPRAPRSS
jgi:hypothetical protein